MSFPWSFFQQFVLFSGRINDEQRYKQSTKLRLGLKRLVSFFWRKLGKLFLLKEGMTFPPRRAVVTSLWAVIATKLRFISQPGNRWHFVFLNTLQVNPVVLDITHYSHPSSSLSSVVSGLCEAAQPFNSINGLTKNKQWLLVYWLLWSEICVHMGTGWWHSYSS